MSPPADTDAPRAGGAGRIEMGVLISSFALAGVASMRLLLPHAPDRFFDQDPATVAGPLPALGVGAAIWWDAILVLVSIAVLFHEARRRGVDRLLVGLSLVPVPVLWWHGWFDSVQAMRGFDWFAAVLATTAAAHVVRSVDGRRLVLAVIFGAVVAMGVRGLYQLQVEHPQTVRYFVENRDAFLEAKGWTIDGPQAKSFERRLRQPEATGWIGFSNVFSGLAAGVAVGLLAGLAARRDADRARGTPAAIRLLVGLGGVGLAILVGIYGSKGAIVSALFGLGLSAILLGRRGGSGRDRLSHWPLIALGVGLVAVLVRGMLPEDALGDRSLLFRWHYLQGMGATFLAHPWIGVGPDGFQAAYALFKPDRSPETVASAHGLLADWIAGLGVFAIAWIAWLFRLFMRPTDDPAESAPASAAKPLWLGAGLVALVILYEQLRIVDLSSATAGVLLLVAAVLGLLVGAGFWCVLDQLGSRSIRAIATVVAAMLLLQGQVEMLFWQPGSIFACGLLVAAATSIPLMRPSVRSTTPWIAGLGALVLATPMFVAAARQSVIDGRIRAAVDVLHPYSNGDPVPIAARREAVETLLAGPIVWRQENLVRGAIEQRLLAGAPEDLQEASRIADEWFEARPGPASASLRVLVRRSAAARDDDPTSQQRALEAVRDAIAFSPRQATRRLEEAELLARLGRCLEADAALREAERIDLARSLDPLVQFADRDRDRIAAVRGACDLGPVPEGDPADQGRSAAPPRP